MSPAKIGRNDPCPCGSGKKYKKCGCGWKAPVMPEDMDSALAEEEEPGFSFQEPGEVNPPHADVTSPEYWEKMAKVLPPGERKELDPLIEEMRLGAELESRLPQIEAAEKALEAHRAEYQKLEEDLPEFIRRSNELFAGPPFEGMRFHAGDVQRAFESVGFVTQASTDEEFARIFDKTIRFLLGDDQRRRWARRLALMLPDYVAAGRFLEGWMIWHNAHLLSEKGSRAPGPLAAAMLKFGLQEWEDQREQDQEAMFKEVGLSADELQEIGYDAARSRLQDVKSDPEKRAALERFFAAHPELGALSEEQCRAGERAAMKLLELDEARVLLLTAEEVQPWVEALDRRINELPKDLLARLKSRSQPGRKDRKTLGKAYYGVAVEMGKSLLTPARRAQLETQLRDLERAFPVEKQAARQGIHGALIALGSESELEDSLFLVSLCWKSLQAGVENMAGTAE
jgi:hypothetical protein